MATDRCSEGGKVNLHKGYGTLWAHHTPMEDHISMAIRTTQIEHDGLKTRRGEAGRDMGCWERTYLERVTDGVI